jgi:4-amino-4-deoxy-L-arabinose transferase-like glycosyltransferase
VTDDPGRLRRLGIGAAAAGVLALIVLYVVGLWDALGNSDEAIYAVFIREMHTRGGTGYFKLIYDGAELVQRPPWSVTLYALVARVIPGEFGIRILPAMLTLFTCLLSGQLVRRRTGKISLALATAALAAGIPSVFLFGRLCMSDPPYVLASFAAMLATIRAQEDPRALAWAGVSLGAAVAFKSVAGAIPGVALAPWLVLAAARHHRAQRSIARPILLGVLGFVALAAPFYVVYGVRFGQHFLDVHFGEILGDRARGNLPGVGLSSGPASYVIHMWRADGPVLAVLLLTAPVAAAVLAVRRRDVVLGIAASYTLGVLAVLSVVGTRLPHYLLVFYPGAAACAGLTMAPLIDHFSIPARYRVVLPLFALTLVMRTAAAGTFDASTVPAVDDRALGIRARATIPPDEPIYTLDYYAPALAYYAQRHWRLLTTYRSMERIVGSVETFRAAGTVSAVPPWPRGPFYLAAPLILLDNLPNKGVTSEVIATEGDLLLLRLVVSTP